MEDNLTATPQTNENAKWYIISCYSNQEDKVAEMIKQTVDANFLEDKVTDVLVPTQKKVQVKDGKKKEVNEKVFPGYVLVRMEMIDEVWTLIKNTEGVTRFIGSGKRPNPISQEEVESILAYSKLTQPSFTANFAVGDAVKITDGPFKEFVGKISEINDAKGRVKVLLSVLGRETPVEQDFLQISRL